MLLSLPTLILLDHQLELEAGTLNLDGDAQSALANTRKALLAAICS